MIKHKPKGWVVMTVTVVWLSLTAAECNEGQPNNTTGSCGYSYASDVFMYVKAPAAYTEFIYNGSNYAFSQPNCVPFGLPNGKYIPWTIAMQEEWKFWVSVLDKNEYCDKDDRFIMEAKLCGNPVIVSELFTSNVSFPAYYAVNELLSIAIPYDQPAEFTTSVVTNCNLCICSTNCTDQANPNYNSWRFTARTEYDVATIQQTAMSSVPYFYSGELKPNAIYFDCLSGNNPFNICP